jgi:thiamine biosynthesis protein ThiI
VNGIETAARAEVVLVRYGELALKGKNRDQFERALIDNIKAATESISPLRVERRRGRLLVFPERRIEQVGARLQEVFGIRSLSLAFRAPSDSDAIVSVARNVLNATLQRYPADARISFRVQTSRADKSFCMNSSELDRYVADRILGDPRLHVRLKDPELALGIEVRGGSSYVFAGKLPGPGGLPVGTLGRAMCLISGGIDSPVAAYLAMKRGCEVSFVAFHSPPYLGDGSVKKVTDLVRALARYQRRTTLHVVPFTDIQVAVASQAAEPYRTVLYRRSMQRCAAALAESEGARALVTGESLGQVASQTLENMACIGAATDLLVLRPLLSYDKEEIVRLARRIGTFEISSRPEPDCCTVFMPRKPILRGDIESCERQEARLELSGLISQALERTQSTILSPQW